MTRNRALMWAALAIGALAAGHFYFAPSPDGCRPLPMLVNKGAKC